MLFMTRRILITICLSGIFRKIRCLQLCLICSGLYILTVRWLATAMTLADSFLLRRI